MFEPSKLLHVLVPGHAIVAETCGIRKSCGTKRVALPRRSAALQHRGGD
jgi:hypothetical protein